MSMDTDNYVKCSKVGCVVVLERSGALQGPEWCACVGRAFVTVLISR